eukprot:g27880.t1
MGSLSRPFASPRAPRVRLHAEDDSKAAKRVEQDDMDVASAADDSSTPKFSWRDLADDNVKVWRKSPGVLCCRTRTTSFGRVSFDHRGHSTSSQTLARRSSASHHKHAIRYFSKCQSGQDFYLKNDREMRLSCSLFRSFPKRHQNRCVIFLHGNCSSRVEAIDVLPVILPKNLMLCCLDLSGSGHSEGEFISLGHFEEKDLQVLIQHLRSLGVSHVGLWGRSMGAATSILRAAEENTGSHLNMTSPQTGSLALVAQELVNSQIPIPEFLMNLALRRVRQEILERASFDIEEKTTLAEDVKENAP